MCQHQTIVNLDRGTQRAETYKRCYTLFFEEAPRLYNWLQLRYDLISDKLRGTTSEWTGFYDFTAAWLDK